MKFNLDFFKPANPEIINKRKKKEKGYGPEMSRRDFLRGSAKVGTAFAGSALAGDFIQETIFLLEKYTEKEEGIVAEEKAEEEVIVEEVTPKQEEIEEEDSKTLAEVLDFHQEGKIVFNSETSEKIKNHWKKRYGNPEDNLNRSLEKAYREMGEWLPYLKNAFKKHGIPERFVYLAIPESHWDVGAVSPAKAVGPYQFMPYTGNSLGLNTGRFKKDAKGIDERKDPVKSADACARLLLELKKRANNDWDLALSGYNGGFIKEYIKAVKVNNKEKEEGEEKEEVCYDGFCDSLEEKINTFRDNLKKSDDYRHKVRKGQSIGSIARRCGVSKEEIYSVNNIKDRDIIRVGQLIKVPLKSDEARAKVFYSRVSGFKENLNYPAKFNAVIELIEEGAVAEQDSPIKFDKIKVGKGERKEYSYYKVKKGSGWYTIEKETKTPRRHIEKMNPSVRGREPLAYEKLKVPVTGYKPETLNTLAMKHKKPLNRIMHLNPAFKDENVEIPEGYIVRV